MVNTEPLVSVVIPVLNGENHLEACLTSILEQSYGNIEVVISDNASTDNTAKIIRSFDDSRVHVLPKPAEQLSLHDNWTRALAGAKGELVKIVCHDDLLLPESLEVQTELLLQHPSAVLAGGRRRIIDDNDDVLIKARGLGGLAKPTKLLDGGSVAHACTRAGANLLGEPASVLIRRSALPDLSFDPRWHYAIDVDFYMRCLQRQDAILDSRVVCCFRVSHRQWSANLRRGQARELRAFFSDLARRYPEQVSTFDVRLGIRRAGILALARRGLYRQMRMRSAVARRRDPKRSNCEQQ